MGRCEVSAVPFLSRLAAGLSLSCILITGAAAEPAPRSETRVAMMTPRAASTPPVAAPSRCDPSADVLGTSRTIVVDPAEHRRIGTMQYAETLPLKDREVVLTFDDGPIPLYTSRVLEALEAQCVKATFFIVGRMAKAYPAMVRDIAARGHTIGTHSQNHPFSFAQLAGPRMTSEIDDGIAATRAALDGAPISPFFRIPGLARGDAVETELASRGLMTWSADFPADDWRHISADEVHKRAMRRLEAKGKGVLLLHDIQPATALAMPGLLAELKERGFRVVHVIAASPDNPKTATMPDDWRMTPRRAIATNWPAVPAKLALGPDALPVPAPRDLGVADDSGVLLAGVADISTPSGDAVFSDPAASADVWLTGATHADAVRLPAPAMPSLLALKLPSSRGAKLPDRAASRVQVPRPAARAAAPARPEPQHPAAEHHAGAPLPGSWPVAFMRPTTH